MQIAEEREAGDQMLMKCCLSTGQVKRGEKYLKWKYCKEQISYIVITYDGKKRRKQKNVFRGPSRKVRSFSSKKIILVLAISAVSLQYYYYHYNGKNMASSEFDQRFAKL